jgi:hypothetical protein
LVTHNAIAGWFRLVVIIDSPRELHPFDPYGGLVVVHFCLHIDVHAFVSPFVSSFGLPI